MIYRPTYHTAVPADAKRFTKGGQEYAKFRLARTGELVTGLIMPSGKARIESPYWTARIRKNGKSVRVALGVKDKEAAMQLRAKLQLEADQQRAGTVDPYAKHRAKPLLQHLDDYEQHLESKGRCQKHISETIRTIRSVLTACRFRHPSDFNQEDLDRHLVALIKKGRSYRTRNMAMKSLRAMVTWMIRCHRLESDPFTMCESLNVAADPARRRKRRALSPADLGALIAAAEQGKVIRGVTAPLMSVHHWMARCFGLMTPC